MTLHAAANHLTAAAFLPDAFVALIALALVCLPETNEDEEQIWI